MTASLAVGRADGLVHPHSAVARLRRALCEASAT